MSYFRHDRCQPGPNDISCQECGVWYHENESRCPDCGWNGEDEPKEEDGE